jgi:hypothetical protein
LEVDGGHGVKAEIPKAEMKRKMWARLPHSLTTVVEEIVNLRGRRLKAGWFQHGLRRDPTATFQEPQGVKTLEAHGFKFFAKGGDGGSGKFVGGLFGDAEGSADFGVTLKWGNCSQINKIWS